MITNIIFRRSDSPITSDKPHYENVPFEVPSSWGWCKLHDIIQITNGRSQKDVENVNGKYPIYGSGGIIGKAVEYLCEAGSTIIGRKGTINNPLFVEERFWNIDTAFGMKPMYAISDLYFFYFCQYFDFSKLDKSTAVPSLTQSAIGEVFIPIPPINEQKRITDGISYWFGFIDTLESNLNNLQLTIKQTKSKILDLAIHGQLVPQDPTDEPASELLKRINPKAEITCDNGHYQKLPEGWVITSISEMCENINGLWKGKKEPFVKVGVIRNANFTKDFKLDYSKIEYIDVEERAFKKRHLLNGDLIVEKSGGSDNNPVGRAILYEGKDAIFSFSNFTMVLRIHYKDVLSYKYLYYYIMSKYQKGEMRLMQTQTTGLHNLILDKYLDIPLCLPPYQEQQRIINKIEETFGVLDLIMENL